MKGTANGVALTAPFAGIGRHPVVNDYEILSGPPLHLMRTRIAAPGAS